MRIAIVVPEDAQNIDVAGPLDVFLEAVAQSRRVARYELLTIAATREKLVKTAGLRILCDRTIHDEDLALDTLLVAGTPKFRKAREAHDFLAWLKRQAPMARRYGAVCSGAFYLGAAGLLDGKRATTHWEHAAELAESYPAAQVEPDQIFVRDGALCTSAGVTAGIDLALALVEEDYGRELALKVARRLVVFLKRPGGQSQFSAHLAAQVAQKSPIQKLQAWILDNLERDLSLSKLARQSGMSLRNLTRIFHEESGMTPADFVEAARIDAARRLLEDSAMPLQRVASKCGFTSADTMRRAFLRRLGTGPLDYRRRFRGNGG